MSERERESVHVIVKVSSESEVCDCGWKRGNRLVKNISKCKVGKKGRERGYGMIKLSTEGEMGERRG